MNLPDPIDRLLEPGPVQDPGIAWNPWRVAYAGGPLTSTLPIVDMEYGDLPAWNEGPYLNDVPKR